MHGLHQPILRIMSLARDLIPKHIRLQAPYPDSYCVQRLAEVQLTKCTGPEVRLVSLCLQMLLAKAPQELHHAG